MPVPAPVTRATFCDAAIVGNLLMRPHYRLCLHREATHSIVVPRLRALIRKGLKMQRRDVLALGLAALSARALTPAAALAQAQYPERPIRLVIPFTPGGVNDAVGRPWADKMKSLLGTVVVENIGGAGGGLGA